MFACASAADIFGLIDSLQRALNATLLSKSLHDQRRDGNVGGQFEGAARNWRHRAVFVSGD